MNAGIENWKVAKIYTVNKDNLDDAVLFLKGFDYLDEAEYLKSLFYSKHNKIHVSGDGSAKALAEVIRAIKKNKETSTEDHMKSELIRVYETMKKCKEIARIGKVDLREEDWVERVKNPDNQALRDILVILDLSLLTLEKWIPRDLR